MAILVAILGQLGHLGGHLGGNLAILVRVLPLPLALGLRSRVFTPMHLLEQEKEPGEGGHRRTFRIRVLGRWIGGRTTAKRGQNLRCQARFGCGAVALWPS